MDGWNRDLTIWPQFPPKAKHRDGCIILWYWFPATGSRRQSAWRKIKQLRGKNFSSATYSCVYIYIYMYLLHCLHRKSKDDTWVSNNTYWELRKEPGFVQRDFPALWWLQSCKPHTFQRAQPLLWSGLVLVMSIPQSDCPLSALIFCIAVHWSCCLKKKVLMLCTRLCKHVIRTLVSFSNLCSHFHTYCVEFRK